jgi:hypothetical protein
MSVAPEGMDIDAIERELNEGIETKAEQPSKPLTSVVPLPPKNPPTPPTTDPVKETNIDGKKQEEETTSKPTKKKKSMGEKMFGFASQRKDSLVGEGGWKASAGYGPGTITKAKQPRVMSKEERMELQKKEIQAFKDMDEAVDLEGNLSPCKTRTLKYADHPITEVFMMLLTAFALYGADINNAYGDRTTDEVMGVFNFITMMIFLIELGAMSYARPKYFGYVPFWLDLLAAISLVGDIPWFASSLLPSGFAAARAGRAARAGTKAGRLVRLIRLTRLVRSIYLYLKIAFCLNPNNPHVSIQSHAILNQHCSIIIYYHSFFFRR